MKLPKLITRKRLKWTGLAATLLLTAAMIASYWYWPSRFWTSPASKSSWRIQIVPGGMKLIQANGPFPWTHYRSRTARTQFHEAIGIAPPKPVDPFMWAPTFDPSTKASGSIQIFSVPMWMPLVLVAVPTGILFYRDRKPKPGCCAKCRYDLTGLNGNTCPECGTKTATTDTHHALANTAGGENGAELEGNGVS